MAILTWRDTQIPDIGNSLQSGVRNASDMISKAVGHASAGVGQLQNMEKEREAARTEAADKLVLEQMLAIQRPEELQAKISDGSLVGRALDDISMAARGAIDARGDTLRTRVQAAGEDKLADLLRSAAPDAVHNLPKAVRGLQGAADASLQSQVKALEIAERLNQTGTVSKAAASAAKKEQFNEEVLGHIYTITDRGRNDQENHDHLAKLDVKMRDAVERGLKAKGVDTSGFAGATPTFATEDGISGKGVGYGYSNYLYKGFQNQTIEAMELAGPDKPFPGTEAWHEMNPDKKQVTMGDVYDWRQKNELPYSREKRGADKGTTASGPYQIVNQTRADFVKRYGKKLFGTTNMNEIPLTMENEEKLYKVIYNEQMLDAAKAKRDGKNVNSPWSATNDYEGLKDLSVFLNTSAEEAGPLLARIDGGVKPDNFEKRIGVFKEVVEEQARGMTEGAKVMLNAKAKAAQGPADVAQEMVKLLSTTSGKDATPQLGEITQTVEEVVRNSKGKLTHAEAGGLIMNALREDGYVSSISDIRSDLALDESKLKEAIKDAANMRIELEAHERHMTTLTELDTRLQKYKAQELAAETQLNAARTRKAAGSGAIKQYAKLKAMSDSIGELVDTLPEPTVQEKAPMPPTFEELRRALQAAASGKTLNPAVSPEKAPVQSVSSNAWDHFVP